MMIRQTADGDCFTAAAAVYIIELSIGAVHSNMHSFSLPSPSSVSVSLPIAVVLVVSVCLSVCCCCLPPSFLFLYFLSFSSFIIPSSSTRDGEW